MLANSNVVLFRIHITNSKGSEIDSDMANKIGRIVPGANINMG